jgi:L-cysteine desulfidase
MEFMALGPFLVPIAGMVMIVAVVALGVWHKTRERELQYHQDMRIREMEHQRKMKELELEKVKVRQGPEKAV